MWGRGRTAHRRVRAACAGVRGRQRPVENPGPRNLCRARGKEGCGALGQVWGVRGSQPPLALGSGTARASPGTGPRVGAGGRARGTGAPAGGEGCEERGGCARAPRVAGGTGGAGGAGPPVPALPRAPPPPPRSSRAPRLGCCNLAAAFFFVPSPVPGSPPRRWLHPARIRRAPRGCSAGASRSRRFVPAGRAPPRPPRPCPACPAQSGALSMPERWR